MTLYCLIVNGAVTQGPQALPIMWQNVTRFDLIDDPTPYGWYPFTDPGAPSYNAATQQVTSAMVVNATTKTVTQTYTVSALTSDQVVANAAAAVQSLLAYNATVLANKRAIGINVSGIPIPADATTVGEISGAYLGAQANASTPNWIFQWQLPNGSFEPLTATQILSVAPVVLAFVQTCNAAAAANATAITASPPTVTTTAQIDATYAALMTSF